MNTKTKMTAALLALTFGLSGCSPQSSDNGFVRWALNNKESPSRPMFPEALDPKSSLTAEIANRIILGEHPRTFWLADKAPGVLVINGSGWKVSGMTIRWIGNNYLTLKDSTIIGNSVGGPAVEIREGN